MKKKLDYYMSLPYKVEIQQNSDGSYFGRVTSLEGCMTEADTMPELMEMINDAKKGWLQIALEDNIEIPEPEEEEEKEYSGQFIARIPRSLHKSLATTAKKEHISLNQYIVYLLAKNYYLNIKIKNKRSREVIKKK